MYSQYFIYNHRNLKKRGVSKGVKLFQTKQLCVRTLYLCVNIVLQDRGFLLFFFWGGGGG